MLYLFVFTAKRMMKKAPTLTSFTIVWNGKGHLSKERWPISPGPTGKEGGRPTSYFITL